VFEFGFPHRFGRGRCGFHQHPVVEIIYHASGRGVNFVRDGPGYPFSGNSVIVYPPLMVHDQLAHAPGLDYCIYLSAPGRLSESVRNTVAIPAVESPEIRRECAALAHGPCAGSPLQRAALDHRVTALLLRLLDAGLRSGKEGEREQFPDCPTAAAHAYLLDRFASTPSLHELAKISGIGAHHLRHAFKRQYGLTPKQFTLRMQIEQAGYLLSRSSLPIKAIAVQCGFQTDRYFCTVFRRITGRTPGSVRHGIPSRTGPPSRVR
jgi:AraC-like DNA-binding protein